MAYIIGIDLGTTNSCVAVADDKPRVLADSSGNRTTPSCVAYTDKGMLVGQPAVRQAVTNPRRTVTGSKRLVGRKINAEEISWFADAAPFELAPAPNGDAWIRIDDALRAPQEISAHVLSHMRAIAESALGEAVTRAVVTVPAYFNEAQRQATKDAGTIAGLDVVRILNEPTAAALAYGAHRVADKRRVIAVFDLGGGTFDISIMAIDAGVFEVLSTSGDMSLGGDDWDMRLVHRLAEEVYEQTKVDVLRDPSAKARLREAAQAAKHTLSAESSTRIQLQYLTKKGDEPYHLDRTLERAELEALTVDLVERLRGPCESAMADARIGRTGIEEVLLVGGMTRAPSIQAQVASIFGRAPSKGAHPDEVVALGAAQHAAILAGLSEEAALLDVAPQAFGVKLGEDRFSPIIARNSMLPARSSRVFATSRDDQKFFRIELYQGNSERASENKKLGEIMLDDLPPGKAGSVRVELSLTIDVESLVVATAREMGSGKEAVLKVVASGGLSPKDLERLIEERRASRSSDPDR